MPPSPLVGLYTLVLSYLIILNAFAQRFMPYSPIYKLHCRQVCIGKYRRIWRCGPSVPIILDCMCIVQNCTPKALLKGL